MPEVLLKNNDNLLQVKGLLNASTEAYVNNATVTVTVVDIDGAQVTGQSWPTTLSYVSSSNGIYEGTLEDEMSVSVGDELTAQITADGGAGLRAYWEVPFIVEVRVE